ncbi:MAG: hypothetical protein ACI9MC_002621, partial [Kiritimatiellia bacterium]
MRRSFAIIALFGLLGPLQSFADPFADGTAAWERGDLPVALVQWTDALVAARLRTDVSAQGDLLLRLSSVH